MARLIFSGAQEKEVQLQSTREVFCNGISLDVPVL